MAELQFGNPLDSFNKGQAQGKQNLFNQLAGQAATATQDQQDGLVNQAIQADPQQGLALKGTLQSGQDQQLKRIANVANYVLSAYKSGNAAQTEGAYQAVRPLLAQLGQAQGQVPPANFSPEMLPHLYQIVAQGGGSPQGQEGVVVTPGGTLVDKTTGKQLFHSDATPRPDQVIDVPDGNGGSIKAHVGSDGVPRPLDYSQMGGQGVSPGAPSVPGAPSAPQVTGISYQDANGAATSPVVSEANSWLAKGYPADKVAAAMSAKYQGQLGGAVPALVVGPDGQFRAGTSGDMVAPSAQANAPVGGGLGYTPPKEAKDTNSIDKRVADIANMQAQGIKVSDAQRQAYLTTGKFPEDSDRELSSGEENEAQMLASYKLPVTAYMLSKPGMQPIIQRAMAINPNFAANQYDINKKTLTDLASSNPGTSGGTVTAAQAGLAHLEDMAKISTKLPSHMGFVNAGSNAIDQTFNTGDAQSLKAWNTAKGFVAGETAKMVKGGVASEAEVKQLLDNLNPNDPNRDAALATFADFMVKKAQAMEDKKNSIMGTTYQGSLLGAKAQAQARKLIGLNPNFTAPQFDDPGSLSNPNQGQAPSNGGHATVDDLLSKYGVH